MLDQSPSRLTLTTEEAADELRCHRNTVEAYIKDGSLKSRKFGRLRRILRSDLIDFINNQPIADPHESFGRGFK